MSIPTRPDATTQHASPTVDLPTPDDAAPPGPAHDGVALGLAVVVAGTIVILLLLAMPVPEVMGAAAVLAVLAVAATRSRSRVLRWAIAVLVLVFVAMNAPFAIADLQHPESAGTFVATLVVVVGGLVTAGLAVAAARGRTVPVRRTWAVTGAVLAAGSVLALVAAAGVDSDQPQPTDVAVAAEAATYPARIVVPSDADAVYVRNADAFRHTFGVAGQVEAVELPASTGVRIPLDLPPGEYRFLCDIVGHEDMTGVLVVE